MKKGTNGVDFEEPKVDKWISKTRNPKPIPLGSQKQRYTPLSNPTNPVENTIFNPEKRGRRKREKPRNGLGRLEVDDSDGKTWSLKSKTSYYSKLLYFSLNYHYTHFHKTVISGVIVCERKRDKREI